MDKTKLNYLVDVGMGIAFILAVITGIIKFPGLTQYFLSVYRMIPARVISKIHDWSGLVMGILVFVHLVLHWKWIVAMTKNIFKKK